jgi:RNA polymerase sigma-70 factor (ECF subfamily)
MKQQAPAQDADLCARLAGDVDGAFEGLVVAYQARLYRLALRLCNSPQDAEEIAQDAFVRAYRALKGYEPQRRRDLALAAWLYRITLNLAHNRARRKTLPAVDNEGDIVEQQAGDQDSPAMQVERSQEGAALAARLFALPERYREAIVLRYVEDLSYEDAAAVLRRPVGTVKSDVHRGLALLRSRMIQDT